LKKNVVSVDYHVAQYAKIVEDLKVEIQQLKDKITALEEENQALKNQVKQQKSIYSNRKYLKIPEKKLVNFIYYILLYLCINVISKCLGVLSFPSV
jgi:predicted RNase H-like nuclease (RuvC/YqgF family)